MDAEAKIRLLRRDIEERRRAALGRLLQVAAGSDDPAVRSAWTEHKTLETIAAELASKKEDE